MAAKSKAKKKQKAKNVSKQQSPAAVPSASASTSELRAGQDTLPHPAITTPDQTSPYTIGGVQTVKQPTNMDPMKVFAQELAVKVFKHLNIPELIQCRGVCKAWQHIIDSKDIKLMMVKRWETHHPSDSARKPCNRKASNTARTRDIEERYELLKNQFCGHPVSQHLLKRPKPPIKTYGAWSLKGRYLAHLGPKNTSTDAASCVLLHDLVTGSAKKITPNGRMYIENVLLTEELLAYWGRDTLCVMPLDKPGSETRVVKLPGKALAGPGHGYKQYIAFFGAKSEDDYPKVWFYNYNKDSFKVFESTVTTDRMDKSDCCWAVGLAIDTQHATGRVLCILFSATLNKSQTNMEIKDINTIDLQIEYLTVDGMSLQATTMKYKTRVSKFIEKECYWITVRSTGLHNTYHLRTGFIHHRVTNDIVVDLRTTPKITSTYQHTKSAALWKNIWYQCGYYMDYVINSSRRSLTEEDSWKHCSSIRRNEVAMHGAMLDMCINDSFLIMRIEYHGEMHLHVLYFDSSLSHAEALQGKSGVAPTAQPPPARRFTKPRVTDHAFVWRPGTWERAPEKISKTTDHWTAARLGPDAAANCQECALHLGHTGLVEDFRAFAMAGR